MGLIKSKSREIMTESLYISNKKELSRALSWAGVIIFWLTFWLPRGIYLGGNPTFLGSFFPQLEIIIPISAVGILLVFLSQLISKFDKKEYLNNFLHGAKTAGLWLTIMLIISFFSRDFSSSVLFIFVWIAGMMTIPGDKFIPTNLNKKNLMITGIMMGFLSWKFFPELNISIDLLTLVSIFGLLFLSDEIPRNFLSKKSLARLLMQAICLFIIFQSSNFIFPVVAFSVLVFSQKWFVFRRGHISPDFRGIFLVILFVSLRIYNEGFYTIGLQNTIPHFWSNFREILLGVGQGQFLPALQASSEYLLPLSKLTLPNSGFLLVLFEQGVLGVFAILLLFIFSYYLHPKRSFLYALLIMFLWIFSREFMSSGNGIILLMLFLFLNIEKKISRDFA